MSRDSDLEDVVQGTVHRWTMPDAMHRASIFVPRRRAHDVEENIGHSWNMGFEVGWQVVDPTPKVCLEYRAADS